ncbi:hypothetical protein BZA05DRAFT_278358 [Tricharina praecox]|uniref:uncharacterized protein n=1 Tax=Tricharina praecox TaxID=43433 RepID=UPI00221EC61B|nr:uncharacterized protein BZA05DRAFT_278358 [Tricharina praecox]KAI5840144.1 hypothetical protein BZA05DRAFT_278358 [Tricharina praecox]
MNEFDRQISVPSAVIFDPGLRKKILFEDEELSTIKHYVWALQSIRVFAETVERTIAYIPRMFQSIHLLDESGDHGNEDDGLRESFKLLLARIERKREEVKGLSDVLSATSTVVEARLAANQSQNVRLLKLVTIAFLRISLVTALFSMQVLPSGATLSSFFVTTIVVSLVTFLIVFNLRNTSRLLKKSYGEWTESLQKSMISAQQPWNDRGQLLQAADQFKREQYPISNWWYLGFLSTYLARKNSRQTRGSTDEQRVGESLG